AGPWPTLPGPRSTCSATSFERSVAPTTSSEREHQLDARQFAGPRRRGQPGDLVSEPQRAHEDRHATGQRDLANGRGQKSVHVPGRDGPAFAFQHSLRLTAPGELLLLDNLGDPASSRVERYVFDAGTHVARLVGSCIVPASARSVRR